MHVVGKVLFGGDINGPIYEVGQVAGIHKWLTSMASVGEALTS